MALKWALAPVCLTCFEGDNQQQVIKNVNENKVRVRGLLILRLYCSNL